MDPFKIEEAVQALQEQFPTLTVDGLRPQGFREAPKPIQDILIDAMRNHEHIDQCIAWLALCPSSRGFNHKHDTYSFKHEAERHVGAWVSHSSMIIAAKIAGMELQESSDRPWAAELKLGAKRPGRW